MRLATESLHIEAIVDIAEFIGNAAQPEFLAKDLGDLPIAIGFRGLVALLSVDEDLKIHVLFPGVNQPVLGDAGAMVAFS